MNLWGTVSCLCGRGWHTSEPRIRERHAVAEPGRGGEDKRRIREKEARKVTQGWISEAQGQHSKEMGTFPLAA